MDVAAFKCKALVLRNRLGLRTSNIHDRADAAGRTRKETRGPENAIETWPDHVWLNPTPRQHWHSTQSIRMIGEIFGNRMMPLTLDGLTQAMRILG